VSSSVSSVCAGKLTVVGPLASSPLEITHANTRTAADLASLYAGVEYDLHVKGTQLSSDDRVRIVEGSNCKVAASSKVRHSRRMDGMDIVKKIVIFRRIFADFRPFSTIFDRFFDRFQPLSPHFRRFPPIFADFRCPCDVPPVTAGRTQGVELSKRSGRARGTFHADRET